jgi:hypothetical protein
MQTDRDAQIVSWIGSLGAAGAEHVMRQFRMSRSVTYQRLNSLTSDGLLEHHAVLYGRPGMYCATTTGLSWQGLSHLGVCRVRPGGFEHAWQVAHTAVELDSRLLGWEVLSERTIRLIEGCTGDMFASAQISRTAEQPALHRPDLALLSPDAGILISIEIELSIKSAARLTTICRGWARAPHIDGVYYLAATGPGRAVKRAVESVHATDRISVLDLDQTRLLATEVRERDKSRRIKIDEEAKTRPCTTDLPNPNRESRLMDDMRALQERYRSNPQIPPSMALHKRLSRVA